ncbi:ubiquitin carboxyl-terminal hydrolase 3 isoform X2 [Sorghum bicolor]|uniref:ubiquitin carboxyl-terminal hydrolase 3 isoform X2 n=1 Tax=Sorghum bicolor TaxID=4558 RepID=UPI000B426CCC|nr:ubiquitin carboxyl-terminal hydrolase 3 isoform X2 [Sorghum bicolor]|eukprot:XP_021319395.1 ubiquitin carboxyl-terminal hydrolase 3 isoform X2 [Sorghum bicolor]
MELPSSPSASVPASAGERWPPLESTPEVFNQFMWSLGVPEDDMEFHDVYGLDDDALDMVPQPVLAVVLCFPDPPQDASYPSEQLLFSGEKETQDQVYFIKQIKSLGNACGTIALLHAVGNASSEVNLVENSCLDLFFKSTASMDPNEVLGCFLKMHAHYQDTLFSLAFSPLCGYASCHVFQRAVFLEKDDAMARAHSLAANAGVTELSDIVEEHYICFVSVNGTLYELDGMKDGPIKHRSCSSISLLQDVVPVIKAIMCNIPNSINFNLMVLSRKEK